MTMPNLMFSHVGLYVKNINVMEAFYCSVIGMVVTDRGSIRGRELIFMTKSADEHHQLVLASGRDTPYGAQHINQISFQTPTLNDLRRYKSFLEAHKDITEIHQINHGMAWSLYFQDPEGNRIELFTNSPWHVKQPIADQLDLDLPDQKILDTTMETYRNHSDFQDRLTWQENLPALLSR